MISIGSGQEMKLSVQSVDSFINSKSKTIRYVNPMATNTTDQKLTAMVRELYSNSTNTYKGTKGSIDLGYLEET